MRGGNRGGGGGGLKFVLGFFCQKIKNIKSLDGMRVGRIASWTDCVLNGLRVGGFACWMDCDNDSSVGRIAKMILELDGLRVGRTASKRTAVTKEECAYWPICSMFHSSSLKCYISSFLLANRRTKPRPPFSMDIRHFKGR